MSIRILLQTTLLSTEEDDWTIARFSMLRDYLADLKEVSGSSLYQVTARDKLLKNPESPTGTIQYFPAHPHEGGIGVPDYAKHARVIATGKSLVTERTFNLAIAAERCSDERGNQLGRVFAQSTFHHFVDYNWDISTGCPSFVDEPPGEGMQKEPQAVADIQCYVKNLALWLAPTS
ncbi:MAG: hypothetical protein HC763_19870 [Hydrococcus sp. CRU_1_1]|jgi:hypothetical protein|nr:hypothetical protein [Hydrococcus sp. CRU_1_1]